MDLTNLNLNFKIGNNNISNFYGRSDVEGLSGQQLDPNYWSFGAYMRRNPVKKFLISTQKTQTQFKTQYNNIVNEYLNLFFGPTGPGPNYGGTGSYTILYNNVNGISLTNSSILHQARILYSNNLSRLQQADYIDNLNRVYIKEMVNISTPPINRIT